MPQMPQTIYLVPSFHYDVAYLQSYEAYLPHALEIIDEALRLLEAHPSYCFLIEQTILLEAYCERYPEQQALLKRFAQEGRLEVAPGMYVMPDMNLPSGESLYRQIELGRAWLQEQLGVTPRVAWIADPWGHHAQLPQILQSAGYRYYVFWRAMRRDVLRHCFRWRGLDGSVMPSYWLARGYSNLRFPDAAAVPNVQDLGLYGCGAQDIRRLCETLGEYGAMDTLLICNGGDFVMPQASGVAIVEALNAQGELPLIQYATPSDFLATVSWDTPPLVEGEFNSALQGSFSANIRIKQHNQRLTQRLLALETLSALYAPAPFDLRPLWRLLLKAQFHDTICGTLCDAALDETYRDFAALERGIDALLAAFASEGAATAYFNPLPVWRCEMLEHDGRMLQLDLPPLGFNYRHQARVLEALPLPTLPLTFSNPYYCAKISEDGYLCSLVAQGNPQELIRGGELPFGVLALQMDYGDLWLKFEAPLSGGSLESSLTQNDPDPLSRATDGSIVNRDTVFATISDARIIRYNSEETVIEQRGSLSFWRIHLPFCTRLYLRQGTPRIEMTTELKPSGKHYRVRAAFPTTIAEGQTLFEIPFGYNARGPGEHAAQSWVDYGTSSSGLSLLNRGTPGHSVDDGTLLLSLFRAVAMEYKTASAASFNEGITHSFDYAIMPRATHDLSVILGEAQAYANPPLELSLAAPPATPGAWELTGEGVVMSCLRAQGQDLFVRLYEATGHRRVGSLTLPQTITAYAPADAFGQAIGGWQVCAGKLPFTLEPHKIASWLLTPLQVTAESLVQGTLASKSR